MLRELDRLTGSVDVAAVVEPICKLEGRIAERSGEALAQAGRPLRLQLDDEFRRLRSTHSRPCDSGYEPERKEQPDAASDRLERW